MPGFFTRRGSARIGKRTLTHALELVFAKLGDDAFPDQESDHERLIVRLTVSDIEFISDIYTSSVHLQDTSVDIWALTETILLPSEGSLVITLMSTTKRGTIIQRKGSKAAFASDEKAAGSGSGGSDNTTNPPSREVIAHALDEITIDGESFTTIAHGKVALAHLIGEYKEAQVFELPLEVGTHKHRAGTQNTKIMSIAMHLINIEERERVRELHRMQRMAASSTELSEGQDKTSVTKLKTASFDNAAVALGPADSHGTSSSSAYSNGEDRRHNTTAALKDGGGGKGGASRGLAPLDKPLRRGTLTHGGMSESATTQPALESLADTYSQIDALSLGKVDILVWKAKGLSSSVSSSYCTAEIRGKAPEGYECYLGGKYRQFRSSAGGHGTHHHLYSFYSEFPVLSLQSDLIISLYEEGSQLCFGQIVVPLIWFLDEMSSQTVVGLKEHSWYQLFSSGQQQQQAPQSKSRETNKNAAASVSASSSSKFNKASPHLGCIDEGEGGDVYPGTEDIDSNSAAGIDADFSSDTNATSPGCSVLEICNWFEIFPPPPATRFNKGGQYRPVTTGMYLSSGYGLELPTGGLGYVKMRIRLRLKEPYLISLLNRPFSHAPYDHRDESHEDDGGFQDMILAGTNMYEILMLIFCSPLFLAFQDIISWDCSPLISIFFLYSYSYMVLLAPSWQYPFFFVLLLMGLGAFAHTQQATKYSAWKIFTDEQERVGAAAAGGEEAHLRQIEKTELRNHADVGTEGAGAGAGYKSNSSNSKQQDSPSSQGTESYMQQYQKFKARAYNICKQTLRTRSYLEKAINVFMWSDVVVSSMFLCLLICMCLCFCAMRVFFTMKQFFFLGGLFMFVPPDTQNLVVSVQMQVYRHGKALLAWGMFRRKVDETASVSYVANRSLDPEMTTSPNESAEPPDHPNAVDEEDDEGRFRGFARGEEEDNGDEEEEEIEDEEETEEDRLRSLWSNKTYLSALDSDAIPAEVKATAAAAQDASARRYNNYLFIKAREGSYTDCFCHLVLTLLNMAPDMFDNFHRLTCRRAYIEEHNEAHVLPAKRFTFRKPGPRSEYVNIIESVLPFWEAGNDLNAAMLSAFAGKGRPLWQCAPIEYIAEAAAAAAAAKLNGRSSIDVYTSAPAINAGTVHLSQKLMGGSNMLDSLSLSSSPLAGMGEEYHCLSFTLHVEISTGKNIVYAQSMLPSLLTPKIYADLAIMPIDSCDSVLRSSGAAKSHTPIFREEFEFQSVRPTAVALTISLTLKAPSQLKAFAEKIGFVHIPLARLLKNGRYSQRSLPTHHAAHTHTHVHAWRASSYPQPAASHSAISNGPLSSAKTVHQWTSRECYPVLDGKWAPIKEGSTAAAAELYVNTRLCLEEMRQGR